MSNQFILKFFAFLFLPAITSFLCCSLSPKADLIIYNGKIYTMDANQPIAEMVAIKGGKIIHVGSSDELDRWRGSQTKIINLEGKTMTPGLIESHGHIMGMGYAKSSARRMDFRKRMASKQMESIPFAHGAWFSNSSSVKPGFP